MKNDHETCPIHAGRMVPIDADWVRCRPGNGANCKFTRPRKGGRRK